MMRGDQSMHRSVKVIAAIALLLAAAFAAGVGVGLRADRNPQVRTVAHTAHAAAASPEEMDAAHEARVKAFPAKTAGLGGQANQAKLRGCWVRSSWSPKIRAASRVWP